MLSPVLPLPLFLYFLCLHMVYLFWLALFHSTYIIPLNHFCYTLILIFLLCSLAIIACQNTWLHLRRIYVFLSLFSSMIALTITMLSIVDLCFLLAACIFDILLCIVSFCVFLGGFFSYTLHIIFTKNIKPSDFCLVAHYLFFYCELLLLFSYYFFLCYSIV